MRNLYRDVLNAYTNGWKVKAKNPLTVEVSLCNYDCATLIDMGTFWKVICLGKDFVTNIEGSLGLRLALMHSSTISEEVSCVTDILLAAGYKKIDPLHHEWVVFESPVYDWVTISPVGINSDPRSSWCVYSHDEIAKRFVREVCISVRGADNVI